MLYIQALKMQLKKKGLCDFSTKYTPFAFEEIISEPLSEAKNAQAGPVLKICSPKEQDSLFRVAMDPVNGEVHKCCVLIHVCHYFHLLL